MDSYISSTMSANIILVFTIYLSELWCTCVILQPELVRRAEKDLQNIMAGGTAENIDILPVILAFRT